MDALDKVHALDELVHTDLVTQLKNRRFLEENLNDIIEHAKSINRSLICAFFELDDFRTFNDLHGNDAGDAVLFTLAKQLLQHFDEQTLIVRYGGSQFCVLSTAQNTDACLETLREGHDILSKQTYTFNDKKLKIAITTGVVVGQKDQYNSIVAQTKKTITVAKQKQEGRFYLAE